MLYCFLNSFHRLGARTSGQMVLDRSYSYLTLTEIIDNNMRITSLIIWTQCTVHIQSKNNQFLEEHTDLNNQTVTNKRFRASYCTIEDTSSSPIIMRKGQVGNGFTLMRFFRFPQNTFKLFLLHHKRSRCIRFTSNS